MKTSFSVLFMASCAIIVEKIVSRYLLIEIDQDTAPEQTEEERVAEVLAMATKCCEDSDVPEFCLGLCSPTDAMSRSILGDSLNACAKYRASIEKCFEPVIQEILKQDGQEAHAALAKLGARFGAVPGAKAAAKAGSKASPKGKKPSSKGKKTPRPIKNVTPPNSKPQNSSVNIPDTGECDCTYECKWGHGGAWGCNGGCKIKDTPPRGWYCHCAYQGAWTCYGKAKKCYEMDQPCIENSGCKEIKCCKGDCEGY